MFLPITAYGHPVLKKVAADITSDYPELQKLIADMWDTMYTAGGVGLAAPQVDRSIRLIVIDAAPYAEEDSRAAAFKKVLINAHIVEQSGEEWLFNEGCLSVPDIREDVARKSKIRIQYQDEKFNSYDEEYDGIIARVIQHEYDHIEGILFVERLHPLKKVMLKRRLTDIVKGNIKIPYKMKFVSVNKKR